MRAQIVLTACLSLAACGTTRAPLAGYTALVTGNAAASREAKARELDKDYQAALESCDTEMQTLQKNFSGSGRTELALAAVGIIAGSIVVPVLAAKAAVAKSAIAGWGGLSGATNAAQYTLQQKGASAAAGAAVYETLRKKIEAESLAYNNAQTDADRVKAINALSIACRYPPLPVVQPASQPIS
jgi:hypothetical protein